MPASTLSSLPGIGPKTILKLNRLQIFSPHDLLYHFPHRYLDFSQRTNIGSLTIGSTVTISGQIVSFQNIYTKTHKQLQFVTISDNTGQIKLTFFNQAYLSSVFKPHTRHCFAGTVSLFAGQKTIISPEHGPANTGQIIAIYPQTSQLGSHWFRRFFFSHLDLLTDNLEDPLPQAILHQYQLLSLKDALTTIHHPSTQARLNQARLRLAIDEVLSPLALSHLVKIHSSRTKPANTLKPKTKTISQIIRHLPFKLTRSQIQAWAEISADLTSSDHLTNRLLLGDVSSGKTILAFLACYLTHLNHASSLILAPTNILAQQHFHTFQNFFPQLPVFLLTSSVKPDFSRLPADAIIIATHSAIHHHHRLPPITLLIVDEQHKFGVSQRSFLSQIKPPPHQITMSATPIPRTISLTLLGHLDQSHLEPLPHHQNPTTRLVPNHKSADCYHWVNQQVSSDHVQAIIVCPFISLSETQQSVKAATTEYENLSQHYFHNQNIALLHGKTPPKSRDKIISDFAQGQIDILVTTPIIEVGIDIPNATIMIIQSADRFGLAQLHQLRGRIGRGTKRGYCFLFSDSDDTPSTDRLKYLSSHANGQLIAEYDLKTRGPGEITSTLQHGFPQFKLASFSNFKLIALTQKIFHQLLSVPDFDPQVLARHLPSNISSQTN